MESPFGRTSKHTVEARLLNVLIDMLFEFKIASS